MIIKNKTAIFIWIIIMLVVVSLLGYGLYVYYKSLKKHTTITILPALLSYEDRQDQLKNFCVKSTSNFLWKNCVYQNINQKQISWTDKDETQSVSLADPILLRVNLKNIIKEKSIILPASFSLCLKTTRLEAETVLSSKINNWLNGDYDYYFCLNQLKKEGLSEVLIGGAIPASSDNQKYYLSVFLMEPDFQLNSLQETTLNQFFNTKNLIFEDDFLFIEPHHI